MTSKRDATARGRGGERAAGGGCGGSLVSGGDGGAFLEQPRGVRLTVERGDVHGVRVALLAARGGPPARERQRRLDGGDHPGVVQVCAARLSHAVTTLS